MVVEYIRYHIPTNKGADFAAAYARAAAILDADEHCQRYEISQGVEEPENWIIRIEWDSIQGHEQGFRSAPHFYEFFQAVGPYFDAIQEMKHYNITQVGP